MKHFRQFYSLFMASLIIVPGCYLLSLKTAAGDDFVLKEHLANLQIIEQTTLLPLVAPPYPEVKKTVKVVATAYSSTVYQTDDTPFITASGELVRDGIIANNMLPFGTLVKMPELYGEKIFVVQDRMHSRKGDYQVDIWMPTFKEAKDFGAITTELQILQ